MELIRRIMTFEYEKLLLFSSPQNKVVSDIAITVEKNKSDISYMSGAFWDKVTDFTDQPAVLCDVPAVKSTSLDHDGNDDRK